MPALKKIPINAYVAWCPSSPYDTVMGLGHRHVGGARLDFVSLDLASVSPADYTMPISISLGDATLDCLCWSPSVGDRTLGLIATGFHDGTVKIWDPSTMGFPEDLSSSVETIHYDENNSKGHLASTQPAALDALTCMEFNVLRPTLIACGHASGGLHVINLEDATKPEVYEPGAEPEKAHGKSAVTCVAWNKTVQHIAASTCANGSTAIWNLKQRKASIIFRDPAGRSRPSAVAWLPNQATQVIVAYDDDAHPSFQMWDLRNTSYPFKEFQGHNRGILDVQFCLQDPSLMLSCGKDNRMIAWSMNETGATNTPTIFSESTVADWQSSVRWSPCLPGLAAGSSHVGGVVVESVQERQNPVSKHVPAWITNPAGVAFGFGGKFVQFGAELGTVVRMDVVPSADPELIAQADRFETTLVNNDYISYCEKKIQETEDDHEILVWRAVETLFYPPEARSSFLLDCLGFKRQDILQNVESFLRRKPGTFIAIAEQAKAAASHRLNDAGITGDNALDTRHMMGSGGGGLNAGHTGSLVNDPRRSMNNEQLSAIQNAPVDAESFFNELGESPERTCTGALRVAEADDLVSGASNMLNAENVEGVNDRYSGGQDNLRRVTGVGGVGIQRGNQPCYTEESPKHSVISGSPGQKSRKGVLRQHLTDWNSGPELLIKQSFLVGQRAVATELCIEANRWSDALLLAATSGDLALWTATSELYIQHKRQDKFLQLMGCVIASKWDELVRIADLTKWEETLALLASYVPPETFSSLSEELGRRLEQEMFDIRAAVVCYLTAGSFRNASQVWSSLVVTSTRGKSLETGLQELVEKLTILKRATNYQSDDPVYNEKASQYAAILANSGRLVAGMKFLCLIGHAAEDPTSTSNSLRHRIYYSAPEAMRQAGIPAPTGCPYTALRIQAQQLPVQGNTAFGSGGALHHGVPASQSQYITQQNASSNILPLRGTSSLLEPSTMAYGSLPNISTGCTSSPSVMPSAPVAPHPSAVAPGMNPHIAAAGQSMPLSSQSRPAPAWSGPPPPASTAANAEYSRPAVLSHQARGVESSIGRAEEGVLGQCSSLPPKNAMMGRERNLAYSQPQAGTPNAGMGSFPVPPSSTIRHQGYSGASQPGIFQGSHAQQYVRQQDMAAPTQQPNALASGPTGAYAASSLPHPAAGFQSSVLQGGSLPLQDDKKGATVSSSAMQTAAQQRYRPPPPPQPFRSEPGAVGMAPQTAPMEKTPGYPNPSPFQPNAAPGMSMSSENFTQSVHQARSTAPTAGAASIPAGMPVPWPIPTNIQQVGSTTQSTAPANQKIQATVNPSATQSGSPMAPGDLTFVQRVLLDTLEAHKQHNPQNARKYDEVRPKFNELFLQLQQGSILEAHQELLVQFCRALQVGDIGTASRVQGQLTRVAWTKETRNW